MFSLLAAIGWFAYSFQIYRLSTRARTAALPAPPAEERVNDPAATETEEPLEPLRDTQPDSRVVTSGDQRSSAPVEANLPASVTPSRGPGGTPAARRETSSPAASTSGADNVVSTRPARDVSGSWTLSTQLESSSLRAFRGTPPWLRDQSRAVGQPYPRIRPEGH